MGGLYNPLSWGASAGWAISGSASWGERKNEILFPLAHSLGAASRMLCVVRLCGQREGNSSALGLVGADPDVLAVRFNDAFADR